MNIIHLIEKIPFIEWEILEHFGLPYMVILYLIDRGLPPLLESEGLL